MCSSQPFTKEAFCSRWRLSITLISKAITNQDADNWLCGAWLWMIHLQHNHYTSSSGDILEEGPWRQSSVQWQRSCTHTISTMSSPKWDLQWHHQLTCQHGWAPTSQGATPSEELQAINGYWERGITLLQGSDRHLTSSSWSEYHMWREWNQVLICRISN